MSQQKSTRREFMKAATGTFVGVNIITSSALGKGARPAASERVTLAHIGVGNRGGSVLGGFLGLPDVQCVAVCDAFRSRQENQAARIDKHYAQSEGKGSYKSCRAYGDFRELLAQEDVDGVVVATHDGWHVPIAIAAVCAGKDIYVEKPLGISIEQNKLIRERVRRYGAVFQYGTQQRSLAHCRLGCELIRNGRLGKIHKIEVVAPRGTGGGSTEPIPVPEDLDYEMWLGGAPHTPYTADRCTALGSYHAYDNALGFIAGWGAHPLDILDWANGDDPEVPAEYQGTGVIPTEGLFDSIIDWDVACTYSDGTPMTFRSGDYDSTKFFGEKGWIDIRRGGLTAEPKSLLATPITPGEIHLPESPAHHKNFIEAIKTRQPAVSNVDSAFRSDLISHLGDIAIRTGRTIRWDAEAETITGDPAAARMMHRPMRAPWNVLGA